MEYNAHCLKIFFEEGARADCRKVLALTVSGDWREQRYLDIIAPDSVELDDDTKGAITKSVEDAIISGCFSQTLTTFKWH
eukprot:826931-Pyramimonas_sp.AAC.2